MGGLIDPRTLLSDRRFDIGVKHRFFIHLMHGDDADSERIYRWHIEKRTGGVEKRSWKKTVDDYVTASRDLLISMQLNGFAEKHPIRIGNNGLLMDGAHRIACAIAVGSGVAVATADKPGLAAAWDYRWFLERGMGLVDLARLVEHWIYLNNGLDRYRQRASVDGASGQLGIGVQAGP